MIQEKVHNMLSNVDLLNGFWVEALVTSIHLINRYPNKVLDKKVLKEIWSQKPPSFLGILEYLVVKHIAIF